MEKEIRDHFQWWPPLKVVSYFFHSCILWEKNILLKNAFFNVARGSVFPDTTLWLSAWLNSNPPPTPHHSLPLQKVMHTRKRHMELFQELNQKFQTLDRFRDIPNMGSMVSKSDWRGEVGHAKSTIFRPPLLHSHDPVSRKWVLILLINAILHILGHVPIKKNLFFPICQSLLGMAKDHLICTHSDISGVRCW